MQILLGRRRTAFETVRTVRVSGVRARRAAQCALGNVQGRATCSRGTSHYLTGKQRARKVCVSVSRQSHERRRYSRKERLANEAERSQCKDRFRALLITRAEAPPCNARCLNVAVAAEKR